RRERLDGQPRAGDAHGSTPRLRLCLDQHTYPPGLGDAAWRFQELGVRQGPVDLRTGGLHAPQARDVVHRLTALATRRELSAPPSSLWSEAAELEEDRKSTRLNSSHLVISYAVFCLKKKNRS